MFKKISLLLLVGSITILLNHTNAQTIRKATVINSDKGLSQNSVYSICKDSKGFVWIGTGDGLNRFDGKECRNFRNSKTNRGALKGFYINYKMQEDNRHCLWFSTERNLVVYDQVSETFTEIVPGVDHIPQNGNKTIVQIDTANADVWFINPGNGLHSYNYLKKTFAFFPFPSNASKGLFFRNPFGAGDKKGNLWVSSENGLFAFNKRTKKWKQYIQGKEIDELCVDKTNKLWLINASRLFSFNPENQSLISYQQPMENAGSNIALAADEKGQVWVGTVSGNLFKANEENSALQFVTNIGNSAGYTGTLEIRCMYADCSNLLWIGTEGAGVIQLDLNPENFKKYPSSLPNATSTLFIKSLLVDTDGTLWMGSFKNGIYLLNTKTETAKKLNLPEKIGSNVSGNTVYSIKKDTEGIYWIGYDGILMAYDRTKNRFYSHPIPLLEGERFTLINQIRVEKDFLWVSTTSGLFKVKTEKRGQKVAFSRIVPFAVSENLLTEDGTLWVSSLYKGLVRVNQKENKSVEVLPGINGVRCIIEDTARGLLYAATQTGLAAYHMASHTYRFYNESNGLLNTYLYGIVKNGSELWVSSNNGIARGTLQFQNGQFFPEIHFTCYTKQDGLQSQEFNTGAYARADDGTIYFGGIQGVNWFRPEKITIDPYKPSVVINELKINDQLYNGTAAVSYLKKITLPYKENTLSIKFIGLEFSNPQNIQYQFKLEGLEKNWTRGQKLEEVRYAALPAGTYTFRVSAINKDHIESDETQLEITIEPPFYQTMWFRICMTVIALLAIIISTKKISQIKLKNRIRDLEKEKALVEERQRISKEMHDDLGAGLTQISLISESAKSRGRKGVVPEKELLDISETSKKLIDNVSEIIWAMNPDFDTFSGMVAYLREQITKLLEYSGKDFELQFPEAYEDFPIANTRRKNILMLIKEAVNNAVKHSNATIITISLKIIRDRLHIIVADNGTGFDCAQGFSGNGLKNYQYRTGLLNGSVTITSENGSEIFFDIPLHS